MDVNVVKGKKFIIGFVIGIILFYISVITYRLVLRNSEYHQVIFDSKGGSQVAGQNIKYGDYVDMPIETIKEGYIFEGWYLNDKKYDFSNKIKKDIILEARWKEISTKDEKNQDDFKEDAEKIDEKDDNEEKVESSADDSNIGGGIVDKKDEGTTNKSEDNKPQTPSTTVQPITPTVIDVTNISLNKTSLTMKAGESNTLTATVKPDNATDKKVIWSSSNNGVVTVNNGIVKAVGSGNAVITATAGGKKVSCTVTVIKNITYTYEMIDIPSSSIGQCYIYIKSSEGQRVNGVVNIKYINGESETVNVSVGGVMKVKSAIASVTVVSAG